MPDLEVRRLGRSEMKPQALGLGSGHLGFPDQSDKNAVTTIREAIELGINLIDTSPHYGDSERRVGLALAGGWREKVYLQTKVGSHPRFLRYFSKEATTWSLENSFKQLQTDYVDSAFIHGPRYDIEEPLGDCLYVLVDWKGKGCIGHLGIGVRQPEFHRRAIETGEIDTVLSFLEYTLLSQSLAETTIPLALEHDVGILLGSLTDPAVFPRVYRMWEWCNERDLNIRDLAKQSALHAPVKGNGIVLTGPADPKEFHEGYESATTEVPEAVWQDFEAKFGVRI